MSTTPASSSSRDVLLDDVLIAFNRKLNLVEQQAKELETKVSLVDRTATLSLTTGNNVATDVLLLKDEVAELKGCLSAVTDLLIRSGSSRTPGGAPNPEGTNYLIGCTPPSLCAKLTALALTIIALIAITVLVICIVAVCGGFPLFISLLNMYTVGACISLPIISCAAVSMMILCSHSINSLLRNRPAIYMTNNFQTES